MSFLAPLFLLGGLAVALPVVFHLVRRSAREKTVFSSLMFLKLTPPRMTRRNRLENILLLLLRCLAICLLSLGFARPFIRKPMAVTPQANAGTRMVILVDTSASMRRPGLWDAAMARAKEIIEKASAADQVSVLAFDDTVHSVVNFEEWKTMNLSDRASLTEQKLAAAKPGWHSTHLGDALVAAAETITDAGKRQQFDGPQRIVLITDLQQGSRLGSLQGYEWPRGIQVSVEAVKPKRPTNAGVQWVGDSAESDLSESEPPIRVRVSNSSDAQREQFKVRWDGINGVAPVDAYVPPGQSRIVRLPRLPAGVTNERIVLSGDDADFDNVAYRIHPPVEDVKVLFLGKTNENDPNELLYYLKRAFQNTRREVVQVTSVNPASATIPTDLAGIRLIIMSDTLPQNNVAKIRQFVEQGGTVLFVMNNAESAATLGQLTGASNLSATEAPVANYAMFGQINFEHPLFAPFADPRFSDFTKIHFWKHRNLQLDPIPNARVLARYDDDDPAIAQIPERKGQLFVFTWSWRPADSQLGLSSKFVPLLYSLLDQAGGVRSEVVQFRVGDAVSLSSFGLESHSGTLSIRKPDGADVKLTPDDTRFTGTDEPGIYEIAGLQHPVHFAVNLDPSESETAPLPEEELQRLGVPLQSPKQAPAQLALRKQQLHDADVENHQKLWRWLIVAVLVVLIGETWLAGWTTQRATKNAEALP